MLGIEGQFMQDHIFVSNVPNKIYLLQIRLTL